MYDDLYYCPAVEKEIDIRLCWEYCFVDMGGPADTANELKKWIELSNLYDAILKFLIIFNQFGKSDRPEMVDIDTCIQGVWHGLKQLKIGGVCIVMYVCINMITAFGNAIPCHHRIMAQRNFM